MGRMFEALKQADAQVDGAEQQRFARLRAQAPQVAAPAADDDALYPVNDAPFIEVGPHKSVEASPGILERPPIAPSRTMPLADEEPILALPIEMASSSIPPAPASQPMTISFRPCAPSSRERTPARPRLAPELLAYHCPEHSVSIRYAEILESLSIAIPSKKSSAYFFTSAFFGAGTTTVLLNLAITAARQGHQRVAVVDANLRRPGIAARLRIADEPGLREVLCGASALNDALQETEQINLFALTTGSRRTDGGLRLIAGTLRSLLRDLRQTFDLVFVDGPRWDGRPEVVAAGMACDAVYVVMPETEAESPQVDQLLHAITTQGARLGGCLLAAPLA